MADKKPTRLPKDFNQNKVDDVEITNPARAEAEAAGVPFDVEYPKHLHKYVGPNMMHDFVEVADAKGEAKARREGYMSPQEANAVGRRLEAEADDDAPKAPKPAAKPKAEKKPKAPKSAAGESAAN